MSEAYHVDFQSAQFQLVGFLIPFVASARVACFRLRLRHAFPRSPGSGRSRSLFYRDRHHFAGGTIPHRERRRRFFGPHFIHGKCDPLHPWNRGRDGYWRCENGRFRDWRDRFVSSISAGALAGYFLGALLDKGWGGYFYFMAPFGIMGGILMLSILGKSITVQDHTLTRPEQIQLFVRASERGGGKLRTITHSRATARDFKTWSRSASAKNPSPVCLFRHRES